VPGVNHPVVEADGDRRRVPRMSGQAGVGDRVRKLTWGLRVLLGRSDHDGLTRRIRQHRTGIDHQACPGCKSS